MADLDPELNASLPIKIVGSDELYAADVINEAGEKKLLVRSDTNISSDLKILTEYNQNITLNDTTGFNIYSETGIITCSGFVIKFDDKKVFAKLVLDGVTIFDIDVEEFKEISDLNQASQPPIYLAWNDNKKTLYFTPNFPIKSTTSLVINVRSAPGQSKKYQSSVIQVS